MHVSKCIAAHQFFPTGIGGLARIVKKNDGLEARGAIIGSRHEPGTILRGSARDQGLKSCGALGGIGTLPKKQELAPEAGVLGPVSPL